MMGETKRRKLKKKILIPAIILLVILGCRIGLYIDMHNLDDVLKPFGAELGKKYLSYDYSVAEAGRDGVYFWVVQMTEEEKDAAKIAWKEGPLNEEERIDYATGFRFLREAGVDLDERFIPDLKSMEYRYYYCRLPDHTNATIIDPADEDRLYIMIVYF